MTGVGDVEERGRAEVPMDRLPFARGGGAPVEMLRGGRGAGGRGIRGEVEGGGGW